jgi:hypothetical protein
MPRNPMASTDLAELAALIAAAGKYREEAARVRKRLVWFNRVPRYGAAILTFIAGIATLFDPSLGTVLNLVAGFVVALDLFGPGDELPLLERIDWVFGRFVKQAGRVHADGLAAGGTVSTVDVRQLRRRLEQILEDFSLE